MSNKVTLVFWISIAISALSVIWGTTAPDNLKLVTKTVRDYISVHFGWYYLLVVTLFVIFCIFVIISPFGKLKLGKPDESPDYSLPTWFAMLFSAGMGIGLVFWGVAEPLHHYVKNAPTAEAGTTGALKESLKFTYFHWGIHAWAIYAMVALSLAYFKFRRGAPGLVSATLYPILGEKVRGPIGKAIDIIAIFATVVGVATTLGFGATQINGGLSYLLDIPNTFWVQLVIIGVVTVLFMFSAYTGLSKGIKYLSNANMFLALILFAGMLIIGPTLVIMNVFTDTIGQYLRDVSSMSFRLAPFDDDKSSWIQGWTVFYWAWWIAWSPFVGIFIARVSRGRTIREFLIGVLVVPSLVSFLWFSVFGMSAIELDNAKEIANLATEKQLFGTLMEYPLGTILSIVALCLIGTFFITSADSATFVLGMQTTNGSLNPPKTVKFSWGLAQASMAAILLYTGGLQGLQNALISAAFPFSIIMLLMMYSLYKALNEDRLKLKQDKKARKNAQQSEGSSTSM
ncbi:glycine betaine uptake BCCT transporter [Pontibacillus marinus]|uniref:Glycine/betaine ABC transporter permease n=1 Tax=Pontibacillus marinus BH030004 = DSM 16465 TaxID=1385511 RepID=A0A0A5HLD6_9BACI|nr:BCCT family transporter [Pontibacillus marinus]KGX84427.1 glycine/betaine ABC transporter permease [Pontibacillus marinus BH030004 = DSM 16465]